MAAPAGINTSWLIKFVRDQLTQNPLPGAAFRNAPQPSPGVWENITLAGNWSWYGVPWPRPQWQEMPDGLVVVKGLLLRSGGSPVSGELIGTLPVAPAETSMFSCLTASNGMARLDLSSAGLFWNSESVAGGSAIFVSLNQIHFIAAS